MKWLKIILKLSLEILLGALSFTSVTLVGVCVGFVLTWCSPLTYPRQAAREAKFFGSYLDAAWETGSQMGVIIFFALVMTGVVACGVKLAS